MDINALRLAVEHHQAIQHFYCAVGFESREHTNYSGDIVEYTECYFCSEKAEHHHFTPSLAIFDEWIMKQEFRLLEQMRLTVCPACTACLEKLDKSVSTNLDDQRAFIDALRTGKFYPFGAKN